MGKYERFNRRPEQIQGREIHPVWRGIGCVIMLILPVISWAAATLIVQAAGSRYIPIQLLGRPFLPAIAYRVPIIPQLLGPVLSIDDLYARLVLTLILIIVLGAIMLTVYALMYKAVAPPKSPYDEHVPYKRVKRYRR